jgi:ABC-2 type transport system ATP-binding protein
MLSAHQLVKRFDTVVAVDGVSFEVRPGEVLGLLGPNGAGKTTAIRMLLSIITPDSGEVRYDGRPFTEATKNLVGYLPEERGLYRKGIVLETILYFAALKGVPPHDAKRLAAAWLARFELADRAKSKIQELSKGNQQKVQFIIAALHEPPVLVLDEPFSGFDPLNQDLLKDIIVEQRRSGRAIIFSTHQMDDAEKLCDRIALINKGKVIVGGTVPDVRRRHGRNTLRVDFTGSGDGFSELPGVVHADVFSSYAELQLAEGTEINPIVRALLDRVSLRSVELQEPSLRRIFLDEVRA